MFNHDKDIAPRILLFCGRITICAVQNIKQRSYGDVDRLVSKTHSRQITQGWANELLSAASTSIRLDECTVPVMWSQQQKKKYNTNELLDDFSIANRASFYIKAWINHDVYKRILW